MRQYKKAIFSIDSPKVSRLDIRQIEQENLIELPAEYRHFLELVNGGRPRPYYFKTKNGYACAISYFFGIQKLKEPGFSERFDLEYRISKRAHFTQKNYLVIANDPFGNSICISIDKKNDFGKIFFYDHEMEEPGRYQNREVIADSFDQLIDGIGHPDPENDLDKILQDNNISSLQQLINQGLDVKSKIGRYHLLDLAIEYGNPEAAEILLEHGATGETVRLQRAKSVAMAEVLIRYGTELNNVAGTGTPPLILAVKDSNLPLVRFLIEKGADVNSQDKDGKQALDYANANLAEFTKRFITEKADDQKEIISLIAKSGG